MTQVTVPEAQQRLPELLAAVEAGEQVTIRSAQGVEVPDDFEEPLEELKE